MASILRSLLILGSLLSCIILAHGFLERSLQTQEEAAVPRQDDPSDLFDEIDNPLLVVQKAGALFAGLFDQEKLAEVVSLLQVNGTMAQWDLTQFVGLFPDFFPEDVIPDGLFPEGFNVTSLIRQADSNPEGLLAPSPDDCSFADIDRRCFIIEYAGFIGSHWDTREFDEQKATAIVDNFLAETPFLLDMVSSVLCRTARFAAPILALEEISSADLDQFFVDVAQTCTP